MSGQVDFCPNCFAGGFGGVGATCAGCGYIGLSDAGNHMVLPPGVLLNGRYLLGRTLGAGGFGITYLAKDTETATRVAIKEYLPAMLAVRDAATQTVYPSSQDNRDTFQHGLDVFAKESEVLRRFAGNPSVVQVLDTFTGNGTAYFAMEYLDGVNLNALCRSMGGTLPPAFAIEVLRSVASTLRAVHAQGLLHRDVSPENIFITKEGGVKLIDFGATRFFVGERSRSLSVILKPGFAPPEQYSSKGNQGPWTDLYALCATFYNTLAGRHPPDAPDRLGGATIRSIASFGVDPAVAGAVEQGLALDYRTRPQSMDAFLQLLDGGAPGPAAPSPAAPPVHAPRPSVHGTPYVQSFKGGVPGDKWVIPKNMPMAIGRSSEKCNIVLDEPNVSRVHCTVQYDDKLGQFTLTDLSSNGTLTGAGRLERNTPTVLQPGDMFYILTRDGAMKVGVE